MGEKTRERRSRPDTGAAARSRRGNREQGTPFGGRRIGFARRRTAVGGPRSYRRCFDAADAEHRRLLSQDGTVCPVLRLNGQSACRARVPRRWPFVHGGIAHSLGFFGL